MKNPLTFCTALFPALLLGGCCVDLWGTGACADEEAATTCADDALFNLELEPTATALFPGESRRVTYSILSPPSVEADLAATGGALSLAAFGQATWTAPLEPGVYTLTASRRDCPSQTTSLALTVTPLPPLEGAGPGEALDRITPTGLAFSPDGAQLAAVGAKSLWLFRADGTPLASRKLPFEASGLTFAGDARHLVIASKGDAKALLLDIDWTRADASAGIIPVARLGNSFAAAVLYDADRDRIYLNERTQLTEVAPDNGAIRIVAQLVPPPELGSPRYGLAIAGDYILATGPGELFHIDTGMRIADYRVSTRYELGAIGPDLDWIVLGNADTLIGRHPFFPGPVERDGTGASLAIGAGGLLAVALSDSAELLALASTGIAGVNIGRTTGTKTSNIEMVGNRTLRDVRALTFSPDNQTLAIGTANGAFLVAVSTLAL